MGRNAQADALLVGHGRKLLLAGEDHVARRGAYEDADDNGEAAHATKPPQDVSAPSPNGLALPFGDEVARFGRVDPFEVRLVARFEQGVEREERLL